MENRSGRVHARSIASVAQKLTLSSIKEDQGPWLEELFLWGRQGAWAELQHPGAEGRKEFLHFLKNTASLKAGRSGDHLLARDIQVLTANITSGAASPSAFAGSRYRSRCCHITLAGTDNLIWALQSDLWRLPKMISSDLAGTGISRWDEVLEIGVDVDMVSPIWFHM